MSQRRITNFEFDAARTIRDQAVEEMEVLCPNATVSCGFSQDNGELGVSAEITGPIAPYSPEDVAGHLAEIGVKKVLIV